MPLVFRGHTVEGLAARSIVWFRALWTRCPMARAALLRCRSFSPAECRRRCCTCVAPACLIPGVKTVTGQTLGENLDWWEQSERRRELRELLRAQDGIDPEDAIMSPDRARKGGLTSTMCFPLGNLAPEGSVIKSTAIDSSLVDETWSPISIARPARCLYYRERSGQSAQRRRHPTRAT